MTDDDRVTRQADQLKNYRPTRGHHRARAHEDAHGVAETDDSGLARDNPLVFRGDAKLVTTQAGLDELVGRLRASGSFAFDSEFIGELTYLPKLCLIQTSTAKEITLIDPIGTQLDLTPFWELVADESVEKIAHAGQQDLEPVMRHLGRPGRNVFDTQICAGFVGMSYPASLSKLVREMTGVRLGKGLTFTHWDARPLSGQQLRYAANDVRFLPLVRAELGRRLAARGHEAWAAEECDAQSDVGLYQFDPDSSYLKVRGAGSLQPQNLAVLRELVIWRDAAARQHDVPPRAFLKDEILIDLARQPVKSPDKLDRVRGLPRPVEAAHGSEIVEATRRGLAAPTADLPESKQVEESPTDKHRADALWALAQCLCTGQGLDADLVTSRAEVGKLYRSLGDTDGEGLRLMRGWRRAAVGDALLQMIRAGTAVQFKWADGGLHATRLG
ncbi:MAG TPA: ribonuclease D [Tepidisphaeraceae bacterium]|nr:ribonuclease D [Tepidisphaeraceae bacterium]